MELNDNIIPLRDWESYKQFTGNLSGNWVFRGQANARWGLQTAIERTNFIHYHRDIESNFLYEFQRGARNYLARDHMPEHLIEWLALMQHHGAPTRLLDFSKSPFIAAYFAFETTHAREDATVAVWALNIPYLKQRAMELLAGHYPGLVPDPSGAVSETLFEKIFHDNCYELVFPVEPFRMNRRYSLQQSTFVSTGTSQAPFMQQVAFLGDEMQRSFIKLELPAELQKPVLRDLQKMNLNRASLFPDLDGYAESLRLRYHTMLTPEESLSSQLQSLEKGNNGLMP